MIKERLEDIVAEVESSVGRLNLRSDYDAYKSSITGPKGKLTEVMKLMSQLPKEEKPIIGKEINLAKIKIQNYLSKAIERIEEKELLNNLGDTIDPTLPHSDISMGCSHPITQVRERILKLFSRIGFAVAEGNELETEYYCFDALNIPQEHPARDMQDSYFMPDSIDIASLPKKGRERYLMRTHTSSVQIRYLLEEKPPIRIVAPGRCFRRDTPDATHSANFHQIEGLYVDNKVSLIDLKATLDYFVKEIFGPSAKTRLRPSFFPFTEPSFEMDFYSPNLGKLSNQWLEIMGCGMVDPEVFKSVGLDSNKFTGFAFGMGIERIAMILQGVDDIRYYYQNDVRFLKQFNN